MKNYQWLYHLGKLSFIGIFLFVCSSKLLAQNSLFEVNGKVKGADGPLMGVTVLVKGESHGTTTDSDGNYSILVKPTSTLIFSYVGYATVFEQIEGRHHIDILMEPEISELEEITLNAGYYKTTEISKTGNIAKISSETLQTQPVNSSLEALEGRLSGVQITQYTGTPGGAFDVRIRGQNSILSGNEPLYVIDGVPYDSGTLSSTLTSGSIIPGGRVSPLNAISPSSIESIEVLKDADATAIYGSRGANGVILITTKNGKAGRTSVTLNASTGIAQIVSKVKLLNTPEYLEMRREAFSNDGIADYPFYAYDINGTWSLERDTDWQDELIGGTAYFENFQGGVSGGSEQTRFNIAGTYSNETTVFPGDFSYRRGTVLASIDHNSIDKRFKIHFTANYSSEKNKLPLGDFTLTSLSLPPNAPELYDENGDINWENGTWTNPLSQLVRNYTGKTNTLLGNSTLSYAILSNLNISANLGYSNIDINEESIEPNTQYNPAWGLTSDFSYLLTNSGNRHSWIVEPQINWDFNLGKGKINMLVGSSFQEQFSDKISFLGFGFSNNSLIHNLSAASNIYIANESKNQYRYQSLYGRVNYSLKDKYIVNLTGRRDGSSRFGPGKKYANFGAIGIAYLFSREEGFNKIFPFISFGKLRASYGTTGNDQIGDYQYLDTYTISGSIYNGTVGLVPSRLLNPDFAWEINRKLETSLELGLWNNCINLTTTYYQNRSSNQLVGIPLPGTTGFQSIQANLDATVLNSGWEFDFNSRNINGKYLKWTTSLNLTLPKNKLEKFPGLEGSTYANTYVIGKPLTIKKLYHFTGVNPDTGLFEFEDYNGDGIISAPEDMQYTEDLSPTLFGGISNTINYKNWKFVVFFQFTKHNLFNNFYSGTPAGMMVNQPAVISARWRNPGDIAPYQRVTSGNDGLAVDAFYKFKDSNGAISDASYIRLKNISIAYTFPETIFGNTGCTLYLEGQNLLTFTKFKSGDPEQVTASTYLPQLRRMSFGVQFNF